VVFGLLLLLSDPNTDNDNLLQVVPQRLAELHKLSTDLGLSADSSQIQPCDNRGGNNEFVLRVAMPVYMPFCILRRAVIAARRFVSSL
jgi:hypothetical protein